MSKDRHLASCPQQLAASPLNDANAAATEHQYDQCSVCQPPAALECARRRLTLSKRSGGTDG